MIKLPKWDDCGCLVELPGGPEWTIRSGKNISFKRFIIIGYFYLMDRNSFLELTEELPDICWKYTNTSIILQYHFNVAAKQVNSTVPTFNVYLIFLSIVLCKMFQNNEVDSDSEFEDLKW
uniref:DUF4806 domain-containing protein n=1 Tax=Heterorhabditis bacteriophora TaxID=37862 RepID=A0A1I7XRI9_HETBA